MPGTILGTENSSLPKAFISVESKCTTAFLLVRSAPKGVNVSGVRGSAPSGRGLLLGEGRFELVIREDASGVVIMN